MARATALYTISAQDETQAAIDSASSNFVKLGAVAKGAFKLVGAGIGVGSILGLVNGARDAAEEVGILARSLGTSSEELSRYKLLIDPLNISMDTFTRSLIDMNKGIEDGARGQGAAADSIAQLGLDITKLRDLKPEQQFDVLAGAFDRVESHSKKLLLASSIFGELGDEMVVAMDGGTESINEFKRKAEDTGVVISDEFSVAVKESGENVDRLKAVVGGLAIDLSETLAPAFVVVTDKMADFAESSVEFVPNALRLIRIAALETSSVIAGALGADDLSDHYSNISDSFTDELGQIIAVAKQGGKAIEGQVSLPDVVAEGGVEGAIRVKEFLKSLDLSQEDFAAALGISTDEIGEALAQKPNQVLESLGFTIDQIAVALDKSIADIEKALGTSQDTFLRRTSASLAGGVADSLNTTVSEIAKAIQTPVDEVIQALSLPPLEIAKSLDLTIDQIAFKLNKSAEEINKSFNLFDSDFDRLTASRISGSLGFSVEDIAGTLGVSADQIVESLSQPPDKIAESLGITIDVLSEKLGKSAQLIGQAFGLGEQEITDLVRSIEGDESNRQLQRLQKLVKFIKDNVLDQDNSPKDDLTGNFKQVNLSRFSLENTGAKVQKVEDPETKKMTQILRNIERKIGVQEILAI